jgi:hypothetical protein
MDRSEARALVSRAIMAHPEGIADLDILKWLGVEFVNSIPLFDAMRELEAESVTVRKIGTDSGGFNALVHVWKGTHEPKHRA